LKGLSTLEEIDGGPRPIASAKAKTKAQSMIKLCFPIIGFSRAAQLIKFGAEVKRKGAATSDPRFCVSLFLLPPTFLLATGIARQELRWRGWRRRKRREREGKRKIPPLWGDEMRGRGRIVRYSLSHKNKGRHTITRTTFE
jgi:hypothetical protein